MTIQATSVAFNQTIQELVPATANVQQVIIDLVTPGISIGVAAASSSTAWLPIESNEGPVRFTLLPGEVLWMNSFTNAGRVSVLRSYVNPLGA